MLTLRQLGYFDALAQTGGFRRAAERCHVSQPALSAQIKDLEATLGVPLVDRAPTGIRLTAAGEEVAKRAGAVLARVRDLEEWAAQRGGVLQGPLRLGAIPSIAPYLLPRVLPLLGQEHSALELRLRETRTATLLRELLAHELDVVLLSLPIDHPDLETLRLFEDPFLLAVPATDQPSDAPVTAAVLDDLDLLLLEEGHCLRDQALNACRSVRADAMARFGASSLATLLQMVANGLGATLIPWIAVQAEVRDPRIALRPFADPVPARTLALAWRRRSSRRADFLALGETLLRARPPAMAPATAANGVAG